MQVAMAAGDISLFVLLLAIPIVLFFTIRRSGQPRGAGGKGRLPPGPWALPVIGHLHHLAGDLPHRALRALARRHGPLMLLRLGELQAVVASSPDAAREIMKTHDAAFASRPLSSMQRLAYQDALGIIFAPTATGGGSSARYAPSSSSAPAASSPSAPSARASSAASSAPSRRPRHPPPPRR
ncbi:hypothetical protein GUJ93_ZPchr0320g33492 [Zizania palustris]|uniref:Uncharacterized protein n=1 Tax=Zizania palustris TaxID=103762 RepID=A0A8J5RCL0_ZIZPA|nr:hypothetical protein GUJ93_ZPchr0320g33492 [Zizania palustris]